MQTAEIVFSEDLQCVSIELQVQIQTGSHYVLLYNDMAGVMMLVMNGVHKC